MRQLDAGPVETEPMIGLQFENTDVWLLETPRPTSEKNRRSRHVCRFLGGRQLPSVDHIVKYLLNAVSQARHVEGAGACLEVIVDCHAHLGEQRISDLRVAAE